MAKLFKNHTLDQYLDILSKKQPVPGGGSAAALTAACGLALLSMVTNYSIGKTGSKSDDKKMLNQLKKSESLRKRLTELIDLDAQAYLQVVKTRGQSPSVRKKAQKNAEKIPLEVGKLCYKGVLLAPFLVEKGNKYLISDIEVAVEMLKAAYNSALALQNHN
ncbi:MAG: cyclodeaminase/cyclohydrolase family protein [Candidatus Omnitrophota bacterium]